MKSGSIHSRHRHNYFATTALRTILPLIVKDLGVSMDWIGLVSALPHLCAFVGMIAWGHHSDLTGERLWHVGGAAMSSSGNTGRRIRL